MKKGQQGIYGIMIAIICIAIWAGFNPLIESIISYAMTYLTAGSMEALLTPYMPALIPTLIIAIIIITSGIRR